LGRRHPASRGEGPRGAGQRHRVPERHRAVVVRRSGGRVDEAGRRPAHELRAVRLRSAPRRQPHRVRHRQCTRLRLRECKVHPLLRCGLPRYLARLPADASRLSSLLAGYAPRAVAATIGIDEDVIVRLAREFATSGGSLAVAGGMATQGPNGAEIAAAVNILNYAAGAVGTLVKFGADLAIGSTHTFGDLTALMADMAAGKVALLFVHGTNPAYSVPGAFQQALGKVGYKVSFSSYMDETTAACDLILPDHHSLEQWGDSRPRAGVTALQQPVVQPVFDTRPTGDVILKLSGKTGTFEDYLQGKWRAKQASNFDQYWMDSLAKGGIYTEAPTRA